MPCGAGGAGISVRAPQGWHGVRNSQRLLRAVAGRLHNGAWRSTAGTVAVQRKAEVLSGRGAPSRKEGSAMQHFLRDVLATAAGTVLAAYLIHVMGL